MLLPPCSCINESWSNPRVVFLLLYFYGLGLVFASPCLSQSHRAMARSGRVSPASPALFPLRVIARWRPRVTPSLCLPLLSRRTPCSCPQRYPLLFLPRSRPAPCRLLSAALPSTHGPLLHGATPLEPPCLCRSATPPPTLDQQLYSTALPLPCTCSLATLVLRPRLPPPCSRATLLSSLPGPRSQSPHLLSFLAPKPRCCVP